MKLSKKQIRMILGIIVIAAVALFGWISSQNEEIKLVSEIPEANCRVHYIDIGQGDCELIESNGEFMLIDAGENGNEDIVINYLRKAGVEKLRYVVATHPHSDHMGGLAEVISEFEVENIIMPKLTKDQTPTTKTYRDFLDAVKKSGAKGIYSKIGAEYTLGESDFVILGPVSNNTENLNDMSVIVKLTHGDNTFLFTGDAEYDEEQDVINNFAHELDCDVYKVGHHGSSTSSCEDFLEAVTPEVCIISCGEDNSYGHPHYEAMERIESYTDEIYRTDICGDIIVSSDKVNLSVDYENQ